MTRSTSVTAFDKLFFTEKQWRQKTSEKKQHD